MRIPAILTLLLAASAAQAEVPLPFADIPGVTMQYYDVSGTTSAEIRRSIEAQQPRDRNDGMPVAALTRQAFDLNWRVGKNGRCHATLDDIKFSATVIAPRLKDSRTPPELRAAFERYLASLLEHEDGHVRYAWEHRGEIAKAINSVKCSGAAKAATKASNAIAAHDIAYDKATDHGRKTIVSF